ncbi:MAG: UDP-N-acetylmuramoyl-tripeptide--D-alanyl-D-alanine ligase [Candidatus Kapabacteria bacterium]|nr:UDP-N-acetylmuramoyl-tripeptide--D-alanyl-D-alanine ligase [Candidatus Kapabacteria bacterium]MCS7169239.1 UDP-N-acetylmuramoyl-tripeptide--D-alanyl-D-alanine ligase [Candidatus Kapabacteria bacterium]MDW7996146.1 UDP-N-acetylmuramoyl-tripeptide--D-alanyl-D-alanine ligase [Bacteroidota bacterium]MDW8225455.1 UDP-N-acetylmuramoyl-tripeptide--D-alanyl-D-alanine ligase [Bacteroidota bacterium]
MEPCIPDIVWQGWELQHLFSGNADGIVAEETFQGVTVDSRRPAVGGIFVALRGRMVDAHTKIPEAFAGGVRLAIVEQRMWVFFPAEWHQRYRCLPTADPLKALGELARLHRQRFTTPVVVVAGSAGKTTTKEMLASVLGRRFCVLKTEGNENNSLGVPLTLLRLRPEHEVVVIEMGTSSFGEIARLCQIAQPTHGIITAIGEEHLEYLGSLAGVLREETVLVRYLQSHGGTVVLPAGSGLEQEYSGAWTFGLTPEADIAAEVTYDGEGYPVLHLRYGGEHCHCRLRVLGPAGAHAAVATAAVAWTLGLGLQELVEGLSTYEPQSSGQGYGRMLLVELPNGVRLLNDTYNANPLSMRVALETLRQLPCSGRRWAVLGDMLELGSAVEIAHRAALEQARESAEIVCVLGEAFARVAAGYPDVHIFASHEELAEQLRREAQPGDLVLLKGSRGMAMEYVLNLYQQRVGAVKGSYAVSSGALDMEDL